MKRRNGRVNIGTCRQPESVGTGCFTAINRLEPLVGANFGDSSIPGTLSPELKGVHQHQWRLPADARLFINGKTAKTLGLKIPHALLIMAEKVIE